MVSYLCIWYIPHIMYIIYIILQSQQAVEHVLDSRQCLSLSATNIRWWPMDGSTLEWMRFGQAASTATQSQSKCQANPEITIQGPKSSAREYLPLGCIRGVKELRAWHNLYGGVHSSMKFTFFISLFSSPDMAHPSTDIWYFLDISESK
jgi:hypothetical protein